MRPSRSKAPWRRWAKPWRRRSPARKADITEENIQSRLRGVILMALSNKFGPMVLTTGNKSEMSVGYATLYGDMCGGYNVLKDIYKTEVFALSHWRNAHRSGARPGERWGRRPGFAAALRCVDGIPSRTHHHQAVSIPHGAAHRTVCQRIQTPPDRSGFPAARYDFVLDGILE